MFDKSVLGLQTWEEFASSLPRNARDTERLMAAMYFRFEKENEDTTDAVVIADDYFRRARWPHPSNLAATANHCAGKGWISQVGQSDRRKLWRITRKGYNYIAPKFQDA